MDYNNFLGTGVALVTPFRSDLSIDYEALERVIHHVSTGKVEYLVVLGTTGESPTLTWNEKLDVLQFVIDHNSLDLPIVFGLGGNNTANLLQQLEEISSFKIDAILSTSPYYNKPSQEGIYRHYYLLADKSPFPVVLYNVPGRTASNITSDTTIRLAEHPNIIGTKEASGDLIQCARIQAGTPDNFLLLSGDDALTLPLLSLGGHGVISVIANLQPLEFSNMVRAGLESDFKTARAINSELLEGYELSGKEGNPVSVKCGLSAIGLTENYVRPPLWPGSKELVRHFKMYLKS